MAASVKLDSAAVGSMALGRVFKDNEGRINSLDFHHTDSLLVTAGDDDSIRLYNTSQGTLQKTLFSKKYGVACVNFTHHSDALVYASSKGGWNDNSLRYLSLHDNRFLRYFSGHQDRVTTVCMSAKTDTFMSASLDRTMRLWDLRTVQCQGRMDITDGAVVPPTCAHDKQGLVFAVTTNPGVIKLYDARTYQRGPFETFVCPNEAGVISQLLFSGDGKLLLAASGGRVHVLDSFDGAAKALIQTGVEEGERAMEAAFSPDGRYVVSGCADRRIRAWALPDASGRPLEEAGTWSQQAGLPQVLKWSPNRMLVASGCTMGVMGMWIGVPGSRKP